MFTPKQKSDPERKRKQFAPKKLFTSQQKPSMQQGLFTPQQERSKQQEMFTLQKQLFTPQKLSSFEQTSPFSQLTAQQQQHLLLQQLFEQQQQQQLQTFQQQQQQQQLQTFQQQQQQQQFQTFQQQQQLQCQLQMLQQHQQQLQLQWLQQQQQQLHLVTNDGAPATYSTKLANLHPDSQKLLLQIEERILEHQQESLKLDQCSRLYDSSVSSYGFESDSSLVVQELGGISIAMKQQKAVTQELIAAVKDMLSNTVIAVHSFLMLWPRFLHPKSSGATSVMGTGQLMTTSIGPVFDFYSGVPRKPSPFLQQTVARFDKYLGEFNQLIEELEQLLLVDTDKNDINSSSSLLQALPKVMSNGHDFIMHVATKVESIHQYTESMRTTYLADNRRKGIYGDPFLEADRRQTAKVEVATKRVHPPLHLPAISQPSNQVSGLISIVPSNPQTIASASSAGISSLFDTRPSSGSSLSPLLSTPVTAASTASKSHLLDTPSAGSSSFPLTSTPVTAGDSITPVQSSASTPTVSRATVGSTPSVPVPRSLTRFDTGWPASVLGKAFGSVKTSKKNPSAKRGKHRLPPIFEDETR